MKPCIDEDLRLSIERSYSSMDEWIDLFVNTQAATKKHEDAGRDKKEPSNE